MGTSNVILRDVTGSAADGSHLAANVAPVGDHQCPCLRLRGVGAAVVEGTGSGSGDWERQWLRSAGGEDVERGSVYTV
ncbi:hypothetical protein BBBOND_0308780 [Babesia bigemina]|uniref:Uncharacterized protein n=1 Tax=Babesia bigemina TaxID=5866 RepID=A0A061DEA5_BABBI|nr:hypothetical protein BBBOND_0308780 [Babesia bigemina]CDR96975.1 hypothetical protein BBBOND_0308780 [Babesia bigemina]|eukprot:XP_012769161.1 hypothetical protein BBBOND_0308780 [Babesia bigemina]